MMLCHVVPVFAVVLSLTGLGIGTPVSGIADASIPESKGEFPNKNLGWCLKISWRTD